MGKVANIQQTSMEFNANLNGASFEVEKSKVAQEHHILNLDILKFENGKWYVSGIPIEEYDALYTGNDNSESFIH